MRRLGLSLFAAILVATPGRADEIFQFLDAPSSTEYTVTEEFFGDQLNHPVSADGVTPHAGATPWQNKVVRLLNLGGFDAGGGTISTARWNEIQPGGYGATPPAIDWHGLDEALLYLKNNRGLKKVLFEFVGFPLWARPDPAGFGGVKQCYPTDWAILDTWVAANIAHVKSLGLGILGFEGPNEPKQFPSVCDYNDTTGTGWHSTDADLQTMQNKMFEAVRKADPSVKVFSGPVQDLDYTAAWRALEGTKFDVAAIHWYRFSQTWNTSDVLTKLDDWLTAFGARTCQRVGKEWYATEGGIDQGPPNDGDTAEKAAWNAQWPVIMATKCGSGIFQYLWAAGESTQYALCTDTNFAGGRCNPPVLNLRGKAWQWARNVMIGGKRFSRLSSADSLHRVTYTASNGQENQIIWNNASGTSVAAALPVWAKNCDKIDLTSIACSGSINVDGAPIRVRPN